MKRKVAMFWVAVVLITMVIAVSVSASQGPWESLGMEDYRVVAYVDESPIIFNALQDLDKFKLAEANSLDTGVKTKVESTRSNVATALKFKRVMSQNQISDIKHETFDVFFEDELGPSTGKVLSLTMGSKKILTSEPELSTFELVSSNDFSKYLISTTKGLWVVDPEKRKTVKVSKDSYNKKTIVELRKQAATVEDRSLFWNDNPKFSPDGLNVVFVTNRDCLNTNGTSLWLLNLSTGEERTLISNVGGENYRVIRWIDNGHMLVARSVNDLHQTLIVDISGNSYELNIPPLGILAGHTNGMVVYTQDFSRGKDIVVTKIPVGESPVDIYKKSVEGSHIIYDSAKFSPDGSKLVYAFMSDEKGTVTISVVDLNSKKEVNINSNPSGETLLGDVNWLDNEKLLIHTRKEINNFAQVSSWAYDLKGEI